MRFLLVVILFSAMWMRSLPYNVRNLGKISVLGGFRPKMMSTNSIKRIDSFHWQSNCHTEKDLEELGHNIGSVLHSGDVLLLSGDLGAGKTTFARGLIRNKLEDDTVEVTSPSYLLDNRYEYDDNTIHHIDLYRLPKGCDLTLLGIPDIYKSCICLIEWPQRLDEKFLPSDYLDITIIINPNYRSVQLRTTHPRWVDKLQKISPDISYIPS